MLGETMNHIHKDRTSRQRRRAGTTLVLAAASGGLLAAAMAGSPTARADDFTDILTNVQNAVTAGEADYSTAATDLSTAGETDAGLYAAVAGFDNIFVAPADYTLVGLVDGLTGTPDTGVSTDFFTTDTPDATDLTSAGQQALESADFSSATADFSQAATFLSGGDFADATLYAAYASLLDVYGAEAEVLASLF
jgi:hypothetical protein